MVDHGIHVARGHQKSQPRFSKHRDALPVLPVWLGDDPHLVSAGLQQAADDGVSEGGMVHIGIPDHIDKIALLPASHIHIRPAYR